MTTVTLRPSGTDMASVARRLIELADGDRTAVRSATTGLTVSAELAYRWLGETLHSASPTSAPPAVAAVVRQAETDAGLEIDPRAPSQGADSGARASIRPGGARPRTTKTTTTSTTAPPEE